MIVLLLSEEFALKNKGHKNDCNIFDFGITIDGRYVTSLNALNEFPELFEGTDFETINVLTTDFPEVEE
jgi:hypothetical protein